MNPWHQLPFLRLFIPLLAGILLGNRGVFNFSWIPIGLIFLCFLQGLMIWFHKNLFPYSLRWIPGIILSVFFMMSGIATAFIKYAPYSKDYYGRITQEDCRQSWVVRIIGPVHTKGKYIKTTANVEYLLDNMKPAPVEGLITLSFKDTAHAANLSKGDLLLLHTKLRRISGPSTPFSFDYAKFSSNKGILYQAFLSNTEWKIIKKNKRFSLRQQAWQWQQYLVGIMKELSMDKDEESVGCAMLLGYTDGFGQELQGAYSRAGVTHILSVSGLHVGLVFVIFNHVLFFLNKNRTQKIIKTLLLIILTWLYALLTGLAPCVQRAAFMFSLLIVGQVLTRKNTMINTLAASAFILLIINPVNIYDYGFQLSYLAVTGIVCIEPVLSPLLIINNRFANKLWKLVTVSLAAQLATAPIALYHFHQFPTWFIPANLVVIPLSTLVMYLGIGLLVATPLPMLQFIFKIAFTYSVKFMNWAILLTDHLPLTVIEGLYPSQSGVVFSYILIFSWVAWMNTALKPWFFILQSALLLLMVSISVHSIRIDKEIRLSFFTLNKQDWCGLSFNRNLILYSGKKSPADSIITLNKIKPWILRNRINTLCWKNDQLLQENFSAVRSKPRYLWVRKGDGYSRDLSRMSINKEIIIGGSVAGQQLRNWEEFCHKNNTSCYDIRSKGCMLIKW
jgi:competence protein ComEC